MSEENLNEPDENPEAEGTTIAEAPEHVNPVWLNGKSFLAKYIARPVHHFTKIEAASGVVLIIAAVAAVLWVNLGFKESYVSFWHTEIDISIAGIEIFQNTLVHFVNDVLMAFFFLVVGVEIKREIVSGELKKARDAALPVFAAIGGMLVPALFFIVFNLDSGNLGGWAIPSATDIAFALGVISLLGNKIPSSLRIFLLTLAVADDLLAIVIIALFYTNSLEVKWVFGAAIVTVLFAISRHARIWYTPLYFLLGALLWWMTYRSGIHPTIAGVAIGFLTPAKPLQRRDESQAVAYWLQEKPHIYVADVRWANFQLYESVSVAERVKAHLHPFTSFIIVPIFALANSGIQISGSDLTSGAWNNSVTFGVFFGLIFGKVIGITLFTWIITRLKLVNLPQHMNWPSVAGVGVVSGIGFTVAIFISSLAFGEQSVDTSLLGPLGQAKFGIFVASIVAALVGSLILHYVYKKPDFNQSNK